MTNITRRQLLTGFAALSTLSITGCSKTLSGKDSRLKSINLFSIKREKTFAIPVNESRSAKKAFARASADKWGGKWHEGDMNMTLVKILADVQRAFPQGKICMNSCYRTQKHQTWLYKTGRTSAKVGYHPKGKAIDFWVKGVPLHKVRRFLKKHPLVQGLGYYPKSGFIHIDVGNRKSSWNG